MTNADFFNINKPKRTENQGGGQSYIDFSASAITPGNWEEFFKKIDKMDGGSGPKWKFEIYSLGTSGQKQQVTISQRRRSNFSIRSQKLHSRQANRVHAWNPNLTGFPKPDNPKQRSHIDDLHIYIARLDNGKFWAGWFHTNKPKPGWSTNDTLHKMFSKKEGYLEFNGDVIFDSQCKDWPFKTQKDSETAPPTVPNRKKFHQEDIFFDEDEISQDASPKMKETIQKIRVRNYKAVKKLKALYENKCQVSGVKFTFKKKNGEYYSEAHHLIPLGEGGADSVRNIVILSPLIHRMMHHAKVEGLDLKNIKDNKLSITINDEKYIITWNPEHEKTIMGTQT